MQSGSDSFTVMTAPSTATNANPILDYTAWYAKLDGLRKSFASAYPFSHIVLRDVLLSDVATRLEQAFPELDTAGWTHYKHINERKHGQSVRSAMPASVLSVIDELNGERFVAFLEQLTGFTGLIPDSEFSAGGGLSQCGRGGFLNIHTDFTVHPYHPTWRRRLNLIFYLNRDWNEGWGGHTELWDDQMRKVAAKIAPTHNSCLIFDSRPPSYHGHPEPMECPEGVSRKTLALYYFIEEASPVSASTRYHPRPADGATKRLLIDVDQWVLRLYHWLKIRFGISDALASRALDRLSRFVDALSSKRNR